MGVLRAIVKSDNMNVTSSSKRLEHLYHLVLGFYACSPIFSRERLEMHLIVPSYTS